MTSTRPGYRARSGPRSPISNLARACGDRTARSARTPSGRSSAPKRAVPSTRDRPSTFGSREPTAAPVAGARAATPPPFGEPSSRSRGARHASRRPPRGSSRSRCTGRARRRARPGSPRRRHRGPRRGARRRPRASRACRSRTGRRRARGTPAGDRRDRLVAARAARGPRRALTVTTSRATDLARGDEARRGLPAVDPDRARAAVARLAADLRARQAKVVAKDVGQPSHRVHAHGVLARR